MENQSYIIFAEYPIPKYKLKTFHGNGFFASKDDLILLDEFINAINNNQEDILIERQKNLYTKSHL